MRILALGFVDLIKLEQCIARTLDTLFWNFDHARQNSEKIQQLSFHVCPDLLPHEFKVVGVGKSESGDVTFNTELTKFELPEGMSKADAASFIAARISQNMSPHGWAATDELSFENDDSKITSTVGVLQLRRR